MLVACECIELMLVPITFTFENCVFIGPEIYFKNFKFLNNYESQIILNNYLYFVHVLIYFLQT